MREESGTIIAEASIVMTTFLMFVVSVLFLINVCRLQLRVSVALNQTALQVSESSYLNKLTGFDMQFSAPMDIDDIFADNLASLGIDIERYTFDLNRLELYPEALAADIILKVYYNVSVPFLPLLNFGLTQHASTGAWLEGDCHRGEGGDDSNEESDESIWSMTVFDRGIRFKEIMQEYYSGLGWLTDQRGVIAYDSSTNTYYNCVSINTFSVGYNSGGFNPSKAAKHTLEKLDITKKSVEKLSALDGGQAAIEYVVILPEDAPHNVVSELQNYFDSVEEQVVFTLVQKGGNANE